MTLPFTAVQKAACRCIAGAAAVALCLASCGGGGSEGTDPSSRPDISPHKLVPVEGDVAVVRIRGVVLCDTGWEMGTDTEDGLPGAIPDPDESQLTLYFHSDGTFDMEVPVSEYVDFEATTPPIVPPGDWRRAHAQSRFLGRLEGGHWWQTCDSDNTSNLIMGICFEISDVGTDPLLAAPENDPEGRNPSAIWTWQYRGENICLQLRERTNAPDPMMGMYRFDGFVMSGKMYVNAQRNVVTVNAEGYTPKDLYITDTYNFWTQPTTYFPGEQWTPPEDDPLKIKEQD